MMRAFLAAALALTLAAGAGASPSPRALNGPESSPGAALVKAPAAFILLAAQGKPVVAKRCGSRGGLRKSRSYYGYGC